MTPDISAGLVPHPERPQDVLEWLKELLSSQEWGSWTQDVEERLRLLEAEAERARREAEGL